ncbi:host cell division inhibitor Icd-like protein [Pectobacterium brasiliense]|uniref:host cell division inhibitor Icd-like protein n=1 Tax=Pectobacterium brasiliense TaxID=180957 RepID=UPI001F3F0349|nr:host cell division inhibitor Icd-like protein [Pectobacterium brasiliense]
MLLELTLWLIPSLPKLAPNFSIAFLLWAHRPSSQRVVHIIATTERQAREHSPDGHVIVFAGRLPVQEVRHV